MPEVTAPEPHREPDRLRRRRRDQPDRPTDVEVEALALVTLANDLRKLLAERQDAGQPPYGDEVEATKFVRDRMARLPREAPARSDAEGPSTTPTTSGSRAAEAGIQWQDEFLNLLVRTARAVKRWLEGADDRADRPETARDSASDLRLPPDLRDLPDLSSVKLGSDLYDRTSARLDELLDQSPALKRLSSSRRLEVVSNRLSRLRIGDHSQGDGPTNPFHAVSAEQSVGSERGDGYVTRRGRERHTWEDSRDVSRSSSPNPVYRPGSPVGGFAAMQSLRGGRAYVTDSGGDRAEQNQPAQVQVERGRSRSRR